MSTIWDEIFGSEGIQRMEEMMKDFVDPKGKMYGHVMYRGSDGVSHTHEFGKPQPADGVREPLTDVTVENDVVRAVIELPGVRKEDIQLDCTESSITVTVDTESRKFRKTMPMSTKIDSDTAKAEYNNGILEVTVNSKNKQETKRINVE